MGSSESAAWAMMRKTPPPAGAVTGSSGGRFGPRWTQRSRSGTARAPANHALAFMASCCDEQGLAVRGMDLGRGPRSTVPAEGVRVLLRGQASSAGPSLPGRQEYRRLAAASVILPETAEGYPLNLDVRDYPQGRLLL